MNPIWNLPNSICLFRILGAPVLIGLAIFGLPEWLVVIYIVLAVTDLIDGPIARAWNQQSTLGASLDSIADVVLSLSLVIGIAILEWDILRNERWLIGLAIVSYLTACGLCWFKFRRLPSFHTFAAKLTHFVVAIAGILLILTGAIGPLRVAAILVIATNLEVAIIVVQLKKWQSDVWTVFTLSHESLTDRHP
ncbi:MAG: CDP-alcohol phosphatidyltransferase family protein [Planctomycetota bacterium]